VVSGGPARRPKLPAAVYITVTRLATGERPAVSNATVATKSIFLHSSATGLRNTKSFAECIFQDFESGVSTESRGGGQHLLDNFY